EAWWDRYRPLPIVSRDAHSLYVEALGEVGVVGGALIIGALLTGVVASVRFVRRAAGEQRVTAAALTATFVGFLIAAGLDWMWELTAVAAVGIAILGLLVVSARPVEPHPQPRIRNRALRGVVVAVAVSVIVTQALLMLS